MSYEINGTVKVVGETQTFASGFSKRQLVVTVEDGKYPQDIPIDFLKDKADMIEPLSVGDEVNVHINIGGSEWKGRYFASITGWKIDGITEKKEAQYDEYDDDVPY